MPSMTRKPKNGKPAAAPAPKPEPEARPVLYPEITVNGVPIPPDKLRIPAAVMKKILGWETEEEYKQRCEASDDPATRAKGIAGFGDEYLLLDTRGRKVRCWNNLDNRPFDQTTHDKYEQDQLNRQWAGAGTMDGNEMLTCATADGKAVQVPRYTTNGETMIVSRTGKVHSGQHTGTAIVTAAEKWAANPGAYPGWAEEPFLERLVVFGVSDDDRVVRTLDNVRPRQLSDTVYTSDIFRNGPDGKPRPQRDRKELSRMLDAAVDLLWRRTGAGGENEPGRALQTHATSFDFLDRHPRLRNAVVHLFEKNRDRRISMLKLSAGQCAACLYLMGTAKSDPDEYLKDRTEARLDAGLWDRAEEFFVALAAEQDRGFKRVAEALYDLKEVGDGLGGRMEEKIAVLAAAWKRFLADEEIMDNETAVEDGGLMLAYGEDRNGNRVILDPPTFGGIDMGHNPAPPERVTPKQAEEAKAKAAEKKAAEALAETGLKESEGDKLAALRADHPNAILLFRNKAGDYNAFGEDADTLGRDLGMAVRKTPTGPLAVVPASGFEAAVRDLQAKGYNLKTVAEVNGVATVTELKPRADKAGAPVKAAPKLTRPTPEVAKQNGSQPAPAKKGGKKGPALKGGTN